MKSNTPLKINEANPLETLMHDRRKLGDYSWQELSELAKAAQAFADAALKRRNSTGGCPKE